jgi:hypothetical protein
LDFDPVSDPDPYYLLQKKGQYFIKAKDVRYSIFDNWPPGSGSVIHIQDYGSADPDPYKIFKDQEHS